jgi:hypothetical protein
MAIIFIQEIPFNIGIYYEELSNLDMRTFISVSFMDMIKFRITLFETNRFSRMNLNTDNYAFLFTLVFVKRLEITQMYRCMRITNYN